MIWRAAALCLLAAPVWAEDAVAPDYFVDTVMATSVAQQLARACPKLSLNPQTVAKDSDDLMNQLASDGIMSPSQMPWAADANMRIEIKVQAFLTEYGLDAPSEDKVCEAGLAEISAGSEIGRYLLEVPA